MIKVVWVKEVYIFFSTVTIKTIQANVSSCLLFAARKQTIGLSKYFMASTLSGSFSLSPSFLCFKGPMFILFNFAPLPQILLKVYGMKRILNKSVTESF